MTPTVKRPARVRAVALLLLSCAGILPACAPPLYVSNTTHAPLHAERGEVRAAGSIGSSGFDTHASAALTDHVGVMGSLSISGIFSDETRLLSAASGSRHKHLYGEVGAGYYGVSGERNRFRYALFGGYGLGSARTLEGELPFFEDDQEQRIEGRYQRLFVQPSAGFVTDYFEAAITLRGTWVDFYDLDAEPALGANGRTQPQRSNFLVEPTFTVGAGLRNAKLFLQYGYAVAAAESSWKPAAPAGRGIGSLDPLVYEWKYFSIGVQVQLSQVF